MRWLGLSRVGTREHQQEIKAELKARQTALRAAERRLEKYARTKRLSKEVIEHLRTRHEHRAGQLPDNLTDGLDRRRQTAELKKELIDLERDFIYDMLRDGKITDEARRRIEYELDLEEASLANRRESDGGWL